VVVATRDRPELLRLALDSILGQRYDGDVEVVVVFDQSEPDTDLVRDDPHRAVRVVANARTPGLAGARNTGIGLATGELLAFCDDDDLWSAGKLDAQVAVLEADPTMEFVTCGLFVQFGRKTTVRVLDRDRITFADLIHSRVMEAHPSGYLVRRAAVVGPDGDLDHPGDAIGPVDESLPGSYAEDYDWILRAARRAPVGAVPLPLIKIIWGKTSFFAERWETIYAALAHLLDAHPEFQQDPVGLARIEGQQAFALASLGQRGPARKLARRTLAHDRGERRAWLALLVATGLVRSEHVVRIVQATGRGI
jgi:glycosyltransferase involved in cell wall biosynthesis